MCQGLPLVWGVCSGEVMVPAADVLDCPLVSPAQATHKLVWGRPQEVCVKGKIEPRISVGRRTDGYSLHEPMEPPETDRSCCPSPNYPLEESKDSNPTRLNLLFGFIAM